MGYDEGEIAALAREESRIRALIEQEQAQNGARPGALLRPVQARVTSLYGYRIHPITGVSRLHGGWDFGASCGTPIVASSAGRVFFVGWKGGFGNTVMIDHGGGVATLYAHQSSVAVSYGEQVASGEVIGWVGTTGQSTGCHLHWEVRIGGNPSDPASHI